MCIGIKERLSFDLEIKNKISPPLPREKGSFPSLIFIAETKRVINTSSINLKGLQDSLGRVLYIITLSLVSGSIPER